MEKALVLYSGGLDSRLVVALLKEKYKLEALHFNLAFGCGCCDLSCNFNFTQMQGVKLTVFDVCKGKLLDEYLKILKNPQHGVGKGINPCVDCKIWMFKKAKEYADKHKIKIIATGEVVGQRPMSQTRQALDLIDRKIGFKPLRPLIELGLQGRKRVVQMKLAEKYKIKYPTPSGGCLLCEKAVKNRLKFLINNNLINEKTLKLSTLGRHFLINSCWFVVGRNENENLIIEKFKNSIESDKGKPAVYFQDVRKVNCSINAADSCEQLSFSEHPKVPNKPHTKVCGKTQGLFDIKEKQKALEIQKAYELKDYDKFKEFKL